MRYGGDNCIGCKGPCQMPGWITYCNGPNYPNNPERQQLAIARWHLPVATPAEVAASRAFVLPATLGCTACRRFAFSAPTVCFWCRRGG